MRFTKSGMYTTVRVWSVQVGQIVCNERLFALDPSEFSPIQLFVIWSTEQKISYASELIVIIINFQLNTVSFSYFFWFLDFLRILYVFIECITIVRLSDYSYHWNFLYSVHISVAYWIHKNDWVKLNRLHFHSNLTGLIWEQSRAFRKPQLSAGVTSGRLTQVHHWGDNTGPSEIIKCSFSSCVDSYSSDWLIVIVGDRKIIR